MKRPWAWLVPVIALATAIALTVPSPVLAPRGALALAGTTAVAYLAAAVIAGTRYRTERDPHDLLVATGLLTMFIQIALFGVLWPLAHLLDAGHLLEMRAGRAAGQVVFIWGRAPAIGLVLGWAVAGATFVSAHRWRERRGRPPIEPVRVLFATVVLLGAADLITWVAFTLRLPCVVEGCPPGEGTGATGAILAIAATVLLALALVRELLRAEPHLGSRLIPALAAAIPIPLSIARWPTIGLGYWAWADLLTVAVPTLAIWAYLLAHTTERSGMRRATDRAQQVLDGRAEVASTLAHEMRSPVASIKSLATTTSQSYDRLSDAERLEFVGLIRREADRLLGTLDRSSLALKIDAGMLAYDRRPEDLASVIRGAIESADVGGRHIGSELTEGIAARVDRKHVAEAIRQVVENAARFSPADQPIRVTSRMDGTGAALIEVIDRGPGIPDERRGEVFERFARWRPAGYEDRSGAGLGLFISRAIMREHGGDVLIDDGPDGGSIVRIRVPMEV